jgi:hypothetical protein
MIRYSRMETRQEVRYTIQNQDLSQVQTTKSELV